MKPVPVATVLLLACTCAHGQPGSEPSFEVASVKPASPDAKAITCSGGPGTSSPGIWRCSNVPLGFVITRAYGFEAYQFPPHDPCCRARFDFAAKVPPGATKEQSRQMLRGLLEERFHFAFHYQPKEMPVYDLTVDERGPKMKPSPPGAVPPEEDPWAIAPFTTGRDGYPVFPPGRAGLAGIGGRYRWVAFHVPMEEIVRTLSFHLGRPVLDATGLTATYDIDLRWGIDIAFVTERAGIREQVGELPEGTQGPPLPRAVRDQLGLKLTSRKGTGEIVVVDRLDKVPAGN
ncbi:MAG: TIGR03435 family protein [Acidobacteria bacterium]|nr:TIGR03435 family protein [Acidobacteriota bacterium]